MTLTEARARLGVLRAQVLPEKELEHALDRLAAWALRWGPAVGIVPAGEDRPPGLAVEVGGSAHLFGGEAALASRALAALGRDGTGADAAVAGTLGAAYAVSAARGRERLRDRRASASAAAPPPLPPPARACGLERVRRPFADAVGGGDARRSPSTEAAHGLEAPALVPPGGEAAALSPVPIGLLRLDPDVVRRLGRLGVRTCSALVALPRASIAHRFGATVVRRLAEALDELPEPLDVYRPPETFAARIELPEPSERPEAIIFALRRLLDDASAWLLARGEGARRIVLGIRAEESGRAAATANGGGVAERDGRLEVEVALLAPKRDARRLLALVQARLATVREPGPVEALDLAILETAPLRGRQVEAFAVSAAPREATADLVERLVARIGEAGVLRAELIADARPERAFRLVPATRTASGAVRISKLRGRRPARLFDPPRSVADSGGSAPRGLRTARGPERIETGWWDGAGEARDYHELEDAEGRRYWGFRMEGRWRLHGCFA
jgi:protein ImuB